MSSETPQGEQSQQSEQPQQTPTTPAPPQGPAPPGPPMYPPPGAVPPGWRPMPPRPAPRPSSAWKWGCGIAAGLVLLMVLLVVFVVAVAKAGGMRGNIAVIRVEGVIQSGGSGSSLFGGTSAGSGTIVSQLERASEDATIEAILLRVNSPGGSAAASQEIYDAVVRAKKEKPVVVSMGDAAASGGYYVSCPASLIYADPATLTGSIGVITQYMNYQGLMEKVGVKTVTMKSGKLKDMLSPTEPLSEEARAVIEGIIGEVYKQFVEAVAEGRKGKLTRAQVVKLADGRVYCGTQAKDLKLIDELGGMHEALQAAGRLAGVSPTPREYVTPSLLRELLSSEAAGTRGKVTVEVTGGLLYNDFAARLIPGPWQALPRPEEP